MNWIEALYRTYENNTDHIGDPNDDVPLLPVSHTTQNAQITIVIDEAGVFRRAVLVSKSEARTIIPATEKSAGRTNGPVPHPLCDKLQYVAADYKEFGGTKEERFPEYIQQLAAWCASPFSHEKVRAVLAYVRTGRIIEDLVRSGVLYAGDDGKLMEKSAFQNTDIPEIFKLIQGDNDQSEAFVRFSVEKTGDPQAYLWSDPSVWGSWARYYESLKSEKDLCLTTGEETFLADQHPAKIRNSGDSAKLISSNDNSGFTFRGRFTTAGEACGVSFTVTQKAHSALRWLIPRQGRRDGDQAVVAWAVSGVDVPDLLTDTFTLLFNDALVEVQCEQGYTAQEIGIAFAKKIAGYAAHLGPTDNVIVMGLDSATPGRMAMTFYRELTGSELLERVEDWHTECSWRQYFGKNRIFVGAPAPRDIAEVAYGRKLDDKLRKATVERLLPCIVDGAPIPKDLVESCVRRASNRNGIEFWEWEKALGIACALYRYQQKERNYTMALDRERKTRDYLYGRLLALAERLEEYALYVGGEKRETNAGKLMQRFSERPYSTWLIVETALTPSKVRLRTRRPGFLHAIEMEMDEIHALFDADDFTSDKRLAGEFLLGYHCQRAARHESDETVEDQEEIQG